MSLKETLALLAGWRARPWSLGFPRYFYLPACNTKKDRFPSSLFHLRICTLPKYLASCESLWYLLTAADAKITSWLQQLDLCFQMWRKAGMPSRILSQVSNHLQCMTMWALHSISCKAALNCRVWDSGYSGAWPCHCLLQNMHSVLFGGGVALLILKDQKHIFKGNLMHSEPKLGSQLRTTKWKDYFLYTGYSRLLTWPIMRAYSLTEG